MGKTQPATKAQARRMEVLASQVGCICCLILGLGYVEPEIHHLVEGGKRLGHDYTIPLCPWHHQGKGNLPAPPPTPSLALNKREFVRVFGTERYLVGLADYHYLRAEGLIVGSLGPKPNGAKQ